ncbi:MAG: hypothetical protein WCO42_03895 [bacterium]
MKHTKQILFWSILAVSLILGVWWILYVPYRPDRVFAAIPADASVVSVHHNLADDWDPVFNNPMLLRAIKAAGVEDGDLAGLATNKVVREWTEKLASDQLVMAYMPAMGPQHKPALIAASWIGRQSRLLRWQVSWIRSRDLIPISFDNGHLTVWLTRTKFGKTNLRLSLALSEGLVLACISEDPFGVRTLLESAENYPDRRTALASGKPDSARGLLAGFPKHWGWFDAGHKPVAFQIDIKPERLMLDMAGTVPLPASVSLNEAEGTKKAMELLGGTSDFLSLLPLNWISALIPQEPSSLLMETVRELADTNNAPSHALAFTAILDQDHNGRIRGPMGQKLRALVKGVKVPTVLVGFQVRDEADADSRIRHAVEQLNSRYGLSLATSLFESENGLRLTSIQENRKNFYGSFEPGERAAYAVTGNWLILASNASSLKKLLTQPANGKTIWEVAPSSSASASGWANLNGIGQTLKTTAGVAKLAALFDASSEAPATRETLDQVGIAAAILRELNQAQMTVNASQTGFQLKLVIGSRL